MAALAHFTVLCSTAELPPDNIIAPGKTTVWSTSQVWLPQAAPAPVPDSLVGQDRRLSPARPGFNSRSGNASRAPLAERSAVNRQVLGSIPSGGAYLLQFFFGLQLPKIGEMEPLAVAPRTHGATAARRIPDPKVGGSNPSGFIPFFGFHCVGFVSTRATRWRMHCLQSSVGRAVGC